MFIAVPAVLRSKPKNILRIFTEIMIDPIIATNSREILDHSYYLIIRYE